MHFNCSLYVGVILRIHATETVKQIIGIKHFKIQTIFSYCYPDKISKLWFLDPDPRDKISTENYK